MELSSRTTIGLRGALAPAPRLEAERRPDKADAERASGPPPKTRRCIRPTGSRHRVDGGRVEPRAAAVAIAARRQYRAVASRRR